MSFDTIRNSVTGFCKDFGKVIFKDLPKFVKTKKLSPNAKERCVSLMCKMSKLAAIAVGITFVVGALFSGPLGTIACTIGALWMHDTYRMIANHQIKNLKPFENIIDFSPLKGTIIAKPLAVFFIRFMK